MSRNNIYSTGCHDTKSQLYEKKNEGHIFYCDQISMIINILNNTV